MSPCFDTKLSKPQWLHILRLCWVPRPRHPQAGMLVQGVTQHGEERGLGGYATNLGSLSTLSNAQNSAKLEGRTSSVSLLKDPRQAYSAIRGRLLEANINKYLMEVNGQRGLIIKPSQLLLWSTCLKTILATRAPSQLHIEWGSNSINREYMDINGLQFVWPDRLRTKMSKPLASWSPPWRSRVNSTPASSQSSSILYGYEWADDFACPGGNPYQASSHCRGMKGFALWDTGHRILQDVLIN